MQLTMAEYRRRRSRRLLFGAYILLLGLDVTNAHVRLTYPPALTYALDFLDNARTPAPCGMPHSPTPSVVLEEASVFNVTWHLAYPHRGGFAVQLLEGDRVRHWLTPIHQYIGGGDATTQTTQITLPKDYTCDRCTLRLRRQALEWGHSYKFWSCADIQIKQKSEFSRNCSGHGIAHDSNSPCICDHLYSGNECQYKDECHTDEDCGAHGQCLDVAADTYPRKQCFCQAGWFGEHCEKESSVSSLVYEPGDYNKRELGKDFDMYYRVLEDTEEIEVILKVRTATYAAIGWRPHGLTSECRAFPHLGSSSTTEKWSVAEPQPELVPEGEPSPEAPTPDSSATEEPAAEKPSAEKPTAEKPASEEPAAEKPAAEEPAAEKPTAEKPAAEEPAAEEPAAEKPAVEEPEAEKPAAEEPAAEKPTAEKPTAEEPAAEKPAAEEPAAEKPTAEKPTAEDPAAEKPAAEEPSAEKPTAEEPAAETPTAEKPAAEKPAAEEPAAEKPAAEDPAAEKPAAEEPAAEKPTAEDPAAEEPAAEKPAAEKPAAEKPTAEEPAAEKPATEKPTAEKPAAEEPAAEKPAAEKPTAEEPAAEKPTAEEPAAEKPTAEEPAAEGSAPEKPTPEQATPEGHHHLRARRGAGTQRHIMWSTGGLHAMDCNDIIIGSARGPLGRIRDSYTRDRSTPRDDAFYGGSDSLTAAIAKEEHGITTILFRRKLQSSEMTDHSIRPGSMSVIWAKGQEAGNYVHRPASGLETGKPRDSDFYKPDEVKYHGHGSQRGVTSLDFFDPPPVQSGRCRGEWKSPADCDESVCDYIAAWDYDVTSGDVSFAVIAKQEASHWTGIGFSRRPTMEKMDVILGWINPDGRGHIFDGWVGDRYSGPIQDISQDIAHQHVAYENGRLLLTFTRPRSSPDKRQDASFSDGDCFYFIFPVGGGFVKLMRDGYEAEAEGTNGADAGAGNNTAPGGSTTHSLADYVQQHVGTPRVSSRKICVSSCSLDREAGSTIAEYSSVQYVVTMRLLMRWQPQLADPYSLEAKALDDQLLPVIRDVIKRKVEGLKYVYRSKYSKGSVEAELVATVLVRDGGDRQNVANLIQEALRQQIADADISGLKFAPSSLRVEEKLPKSPEVLPKKHIILLVLGCLVVLLLVASLVIVVVACSRRRNKRTSFRQRNSGSSPTRRRSIKMQRQGVDPVADAYRGYAEVFQRQGVDPMADAYRGYAEDFQRQGVDPVADAYRGYTEDYNPYDPNPYARDQPVLDPYRDPDPYGIYSTRPNGVAPKDKASRKKTKDRKARSPSSSSDSDSDGKKKKGCDWKKKKNKKKNSKNKPVRNPSDPYSQNPPPNGHPGYHPPPPDPYNRYPPPAPLPDPVFSPVRYTYPPAAPAPYQPVEAEYVPPPPRENRTLLNNPGSNPYRPAPSHTSPIVDMTAISAYPPAGGYTKPTPNPYAANTNPRPAPAPYRPTPAANGYATSRPNPVYGPAPVKSYGGPTPAGTAVAYGGSSTNARQYYR